MSDLTTIQASPSERTTIAAKPYRIDRLPALVFTGCLAVYLLWWAAFYPGLMSWDSITYVWQVTTGNWRADHSVLYDALVWLSLAATGDLAALTLVQAAAAALTLAVLACVVRDFGVPWAWCLAAALAVAALPATGTFVVTVWKDVPFALVLVLMTATLGRLALRRRSWPLIAALGGEVLVLCLLRNNGFLFAAIAIALAVILLPGTRVRLAGAAAVPLATVYLVTAYAYPAMSVDPVRPWLSYATAYSDIAVTYARRPGAFQERDLTLMARIAPLEHWKSNANCLNADTTLSAGFDVARADRHYKKLVGLWVRLIKRAPDVVTAARLCRGSVAWVAFPAQPGERVLVGMPNVPEDLYGWRASGQTMAASPYRPILATRPLSQTLHDAAVFVRGLSLTEQFEWLLWRGATWCYLVYAAAAALAWAGRRQAALVLAAVVAGHQLAVTAAIPAQLFRYMAAPIMIGIMLLPILVAVLSKRLRRPAGEGQ
ncbi:hypothetical protein ACFWY5_04920 [Nonomuraea sp. NPDC059007]|uniref:hypothetical protein n=1 Tax=Nonomuraea sp. NPDC059007 TaxID=3346692 RepID=UPI00369D97BB